jgi:hypothetical protein
MNRVDKTRYMQQAFARETAELQQRWIEESVHGNGQTTYAS